MNPVTISPILATAILWSGDQRENPGRARFQADSRPPQVGLHQYQCHPDGPCEGGHFSQSTAQSNQWNGKKTQRSGI